MEALLTAARFKLALNIIIKNSYFPSAVLITGTLQEGDSAITNYVVRR